MAHDVPQNRAAADFHHRFRPHFRFFGESSAESACASRTAHGAAIHDGYGVHFDNRQTLLASLLRPQARLCAEGEENCRVPLLVNGVPVCTCHMINSGGDTCDSVNDAVIPAVSPE